VLLNLDTNLIVMRWAVVGSKGMLGIELMNFLDSRNETAFGFHRGNFNVDAPFTELAGLFSGIDCVVNVAAYTDVDKAEIEVEKAYESNHKLPRVLANITDRVDAKLIHVSTDYVFQGDAKIPYSVHDAPNPISVYGKSKLAGEQAVLSVPNASVVRTAWLYGQHGRCFPKVIASKLNNGEPIRVVGDQIGTPTYTLDLAEYIFRLGRSGSSAQVLHAVSSGSASWFEFALEVAASLGVANDQVIEVLSSQYQSTAPRPEFSLLEPSSIEGYSLPHWRDSWQTAQRLVLSEYA